jgi:hypothetical protein
MEYILFNNDAEIAITFRVTYLNGDYVSKLWKIWDLLSGAVLYMFNRIYVIQLILVRQVTYFYSSWLQDS